MCPRGRPRGQGRPRGLHLCIETPGLLTSAISVFLVDNRRAILVCYNCLRRGTWCTFSRLAQAKTARQNCRFSGSLIFQRKTYSLKELLNLGNKSNPLKHWII